jgi:hypothetical protein
VLEKYITLLTSLTDTPASHTENFNLTAISKQLHTPF